MRLFLSLFLTLFIYIFILFFFSYFIFYQHKNIEKREVVYIHQAVIQKVNKKKVNHKKRSSLQTPHKIQKIAKTISSKDNFSKGGKDISFDELFQGVDEKIETTKVKLKKHYNMTKTKHNQASLEVKKLKSNLETTYNLNISQTFGSKKDLTYIKSEFSKIWAELDTKTGDFISLKINIKNKQIDIIVISTNLDTILLNNFLNKLYNIDVSKTGNFSGVINFNVKLKDFK